MGFNLKIEGQNEEIVLEKESILNVKYYSDSPDDSNARAVDLSVSLEIKGKILAPSNGEKEDDTRKLANWSLLSSEYSDSYRKVILEIIAEGNVIRKIVMPNSFIVDYMEEYDDKVGLGIFILKIRQKKEKIKDILLEGGYQYA